MRAARIERFGDRPFWKETLRLAVPVTLQNLVGCLFLFVDTVMVSGIGETNLEFAAIGMAKQLSWLLTIILFGLASGASVFIAQYWGVRDVAGIRRSYGLALTASVALAAAFTLIGLLFPSAAMRLMTDREAYIECGAEYLRIAGYAYIALALQQVFWAVLRSTEQVRLPMYVGFISVGANALLSALFIYGLRMGVRGAAFATLISSWISPIALFLISYKRRNVLIAPLSSLFRWSREFLRRYIARSLPVLLNEAFWAFGTVGVKLIFTNADANFFAAMTTCVSVIDVAYVLFVGLCHACQVMVGKSVGAGDRASATRAVRRFTSITPALSILVGVAVFALRDVALMPFDITREARNAARTMLTLLAINGVFRNFNYVTIIGVFRAAGDTRAGLVYDTLCQCCLSLPVTAICAYALRLDVMVTYGAMLFTEEAIKFVLCARRASGNKWYRPVTGAIPDMGPA